MDQHKKILVITWDGNPDQRIQDYLCSRGVRPTIEYREGNDMPWFPKDEGFGYVFMNCGAPRWFKSHAAHYEGIGISQFVWNRDGTLANTRTYSDLTDFFKQNE